MNLSWKLGCELVPWVDFDDLKTILSQPILGGLDEAFRILTLISNNLRTMSLVFPVWLI